MGSTLRMQTYFRSWRISLELCIVMIDVLAAGIIIIGVFDPEMKKTVTSAFMVNLKENTKPLQKPIENQYSRI